MNTDMNMFDTNNRKKRVRLLQNLTTLFTDESSTEQSEVNFYNGESKIYFGSMNGDLRDITSQEKTAVQNEISR